MGLGGGLGLIGVLQVMVAIRDTGRADAGRSTLGFKAIKL